MKFKVYTDTSVFGGCFEEIFSEWSNLLIKEFKTGEKTLVVSDITLKELSEAPSKVFEILNTISGEHKQLINLTDEAVFLAKEYIKEKAISSKFLGDAYHIALATITKADVLVSWNFKHIVNLQRIRLYNSVNLKLGYSMIEIRTPREVLNE